MDMNSINVKDKTLQCILCSICPTIHANKHLSGLTYTEEHQQREVLKTGVFQETFTIGKT